MFSQKDRKYFFKSSSDQKFLADTTDFPNTRRLLLFYYILFFSGACGTRDFFSPEQKINFDTSMCESETKTGSRGFPLWIAATTDETGGRIIIRCLLKANLNLVNEKKNRLEKRNIALHDRSISCNRAGSARDSASGLTNPVPARQEEDPR